MLTIDFLSVGKLLLDHFLNGLMTALIILLLTRLKLFPMLVVFVEKKEEYDRMTNDD
jgi:hypothetical protein